MYQTDYRPLEAHALSIITRDRAVNPIFALLYGGPEPTMPTNSKVVTLDLNYRGVHLIALIKCIRAALNLSLVEAKDFMDAARGPNTARKVRMTPEQFGAFIAHILADQHVSLADVRMNNVTIGTTTPNTFDFTSLPHF